MSKRKLTVLFVFLLVSSNIITFTYTNVSSIKNENRVIMSRREYDEIYDIINNNAKLLRVENLIGEMFLEEVEDDILLEGKLRGLVDALGDPYSQYLNEDEYGILMEDSSGVYGGIGVIVSPGDDNLITVVSPIEGTPGDRAGLKSGDKIIMVNGKEYTADNMNEAVKNMKGDPNTAVQITIVRKGRSGERETLEIEIIREEIKLETVNWKLVDENIGYIRISSFDELTYEDFKLALRELEKKQVQGIVLDLRNNPGGLLDSCINIANELLKGGDIVYTQDRTLERQYFRANRSGSDIPLTVIINRGSASASEILAAAIKDNNRGLIVGETSLGKGIVQRIRPLSDGTALKLTESEYFSPKGTKIHGLGVKPDIEVELPEDIEFIGVENIGKDIQLQVAIEKLK